MSLLCTLGRVVPCAAKQLLQLPKFAFTSAMMNQVIDDKLAGKCFWVSFETIAYYHIFRFGRFSL